MIGSVLNVDKYKVIILDNFYEQHEYDSILNECLFLSKGNKLKVPEKTGSALDEEGNFLKKNKGVFLDDLYSFDRNFSDILTFNRKIFNVDIVEELCKKDTYYRHLRWCNLYTTLLSYYENLDYYKNHADKATVTAITWLFKEPKMFSGGNIFFEQDVNNFVECKNNRTIYFPSILEHEVEKTIMQKEKTDLGYGRFSITQFFNYN